MAYSSIAKPTDHFNTVTYTGNGSSGHAITGVGFQPDWTWIKSRSASTEHVLTDSVRGVTKELKSNDNGEEETEAQGLTAFGTDGFTIGSDSSFNTNSATYVSWNWLAANGTASNSDGSATSTVSANTTAGFSIVSYTGNETAKTIGHGLGAIPQIVITKNRSTTGQWAMYNRNLGANKNLHLETTDAAASSSAVFNDTESTSSVFSVGSAVMTNDNGSNFIAYCFAEKKGYSKFGTYTGNGNADGTFVYTGFKPAVVIIKKSSASGSNWRIHDNRRLGYNGANNELYINTTGTEGANRLDILSNGIKIITTDTAYNASGETYIYLACAESPFVGNDSGTAVPGTAR